MFLLVSLYGIMIRKTTYNDHYVCLFVSLSHFLDFAFGDAIIQYQLSGRTQKPMQKVIGRPSMLGYSVLRIHHLKRKRISQPRLKMERVEIIQLQEKTANNVGKDKMEKKLVNLGSTKPILT